MTSSHSIRNEMCFIRAPLISLIRDILDGVFFAWRSRRSPARHGGAQLVAEEPSPTNSQRAGRAQRGRRSASSPAVSQAATWRQRLRAYCEAAGGESWTIAARTSRGGGRRGGVSSAAPATTTDQLQWRDDSGEVGWMAAGVAEAANGVPGRGAAVGNGGRRAVAGSAAEAARGSGSDAGERQARAPVRDRRAGAWQRWRDGGAGSGTCDGGGAASTSAR
ncbi:hypothetical protein Scep_011563 [Stephania cephalantha]|uniref:Uncharacterized protein n=1 Tax=Stephania cephalantha TaxID=152367 RepID=A0AAP0JED5_9MAGN